MYYRKIPTWIFFGLAMLIFTQPVLAIGVQPMVFDFWGRPGERYSFEITITPEERQRVIYVSLYQPVQGLDGSLELVEGNPQDYPPIGWVQLEQESVTVPPGVPVPVRGTVAIPFGAGGSYNVLVMLEPAVEEEESGFAIIVRYAVRLTINVDRPGLRSELQVLNTELIPDEEGRPWLQVHVKNPSPFRFELQGEATIRDEARRLVERVSLRTLSAWESDHDSFAIYPETELLLLAPISEPLHAGAFHIQNFISYDTTKQVVKGREVRVEEGQFAAFEGRSVSIGADKLESIVTLGAAATHVLQIDNRKSEPLQIQIAGADVETDYTHSVFEHLEVEFLGETEFSLDARRSGRGVLLVRAPRDVDPGGYYGNVNVHVFNEDGEYLETHTLPLGVLVGKNWIRSTELRSLVVENLEDEYLFSLYFLNSGEVHLSPHGTVQLHDENNELAYVIDLEMPEGQESILPDMGGFLVATSLYGNILPGSYTATVFVFEGQERVGIGEFPLVLEQ